MLLNARKRRCRVHDRRCGRRHRRDLLLNARKRRCRVHNTTETCFVATKRLLNARKRRCRVHSLAFAARRLGLACSTLESVVVGFTSASPLIRSSGVAAQRSKASLSGSRGVPAGLSRRQEAAQRSKASLSGSLELAPIDVARVKLLNARKRRCRVHHPRASFGGVVNGCSTLESVVVGFTARASSGSARQASAQRSKASLSGSHPPRLKNPQAVGSAQRSKASLSGSPPRTRTGRGRGESCSTLESVVVGFTAGSTPIRRPEAPAQRSKASLSGSRPQARPRLPGQASCSTLESVVVGFTKARASVPTSERICSTLESVVVGFTPTGWVLDALARNCSTLESVVVGFTRKPAGLARPRGLLNARKRRCRVHPLPIGLAGDWSAAQRSKASLSGSPRPRRPDLT